MASAVLTLLANDGRDSNPQLSDLNPPPAGPGVWGPGSAPALGLRLPGIQPRVLDAASRFRPDAPNPLTSTEYAENFELVKQLRRFDSVVRTAEQTTDALFWTDHAIRQWNDGLARLATSQRLDLTQSARMLAMAHVAGGDAMIACFDAKYTYWFWRPYQAIPLAHTDGNPAACHSTAVSEALTAFFGTNRVGFSLDSRVTGTTREYARFHQVVQDVDWARVFVGFHFRSSDLQGSEVGRAVGRYVVAHAFQPTFDARRDK